MKRIFSYLIMLLICVCFGIFQPRLSLLINTDLATKDEYYFMALVLGIILLSSYFFAYLKSFIRFLLNKISDVSITVDIIFTIISCVISGIMLFFMCRERNLGVTGDALAIIVVIFNIIFSFIKMSIIEAVSPFDDLIQQDRKISKVDRKKEHSKQLAISIMGFISGILLSIVLLAVYTIIIKSISDKEMGLFIGIICTIIISIVYTILYNMITNTYYFKTLNKKIPRYWSLRTVCNCAYMFSFTICIFLILFYIVKLNFVLCLFFSIVAKIVIQFVSDHGCDLDYKGIGSSDPMKKYSRYLNNTNNSFDIDFKTTEYKDKFGNITGKSTSTIIKDKFGEIETTHYKDKFGNDKGKSTTFKS